MLFNSLHFLLFFPLVVFVYFTIPSRIKWVWLLVTSYYFYMCWNPIYVFLMLGSTLVTYLCGIVLNILDDSALEERNKTHNKKILLAVSLMLNLSVLFFFKYFNFLNDSLREILGSVGINYTINNFDFLLPVGISFYTFEVISYTIDVYRGTVKAEKNFFRYALFVAFFPKLVAGPIERPTNLLPQLNKNHTFNLDEARSGLMLMLWGFFQKIIIADRLAILANTVFNDVEKYKGFQFVIAILFFSFQIFCDFSAYSDIATGASRILGFKLLNNFERPYFAQNIRDFWRKWHISLSTWFKDYLYFPLGGNKKGKWNTYRNIMIVFIVSGVWHGANWTFVVWGALHGIYQVCSILFAPYQTKIIQRLGADEETFSVKFFNVLITFSLVCFAWIFFRANTIGDAFFIVRNIFTYNPETILTDELYSLGLEATEFRIAVYSIMLLLIVHFFQRQYKLREFIMKQTLPFRWAAYLIAILSILIYGIYGSTYDASQFIYFQF